MIEARTPRPFGIRVARDGRVEAAPFDPVFSHVAFDHLPRRFPHPEMASGAHPHINTRNKIQQMPVNRWAVRTVARRSVRRLRPDRHPAAFPRSCCEPALNPGVAQSKCIFPGAIPIRLYKTLGTVCYCRQLGTRSEDVAREYLHVFERPVQ